MMTFVPHCQTNWLPWSTGRPSPFSWVPALCNDIASCHKIQEVMSSMYDPLGLTAIVESLTCSLRLGEKTEESEVMCQCCS